MPERFSDLRDDMLYLFERVKSMIVSGELLLPKYINLNIDDASIFNESLKMLPEYQRVLEQLINCKSFRRYFEQVEPIVEADDWEESNATHLRQLPWLAVEVIRSFINDSLISGKPDKVLNVLCTFFDERCMLTPIKIHIESSVEIEIHEEPVWLNDNLRLFSQKDDKGRSLYILEIKDFKARVSEFLDSVDIEHVFSMIRKVLGHFMVSVFLVGLRDNKIRENKEESLPDSSHRIIFHNVIGIDIKRIVTTGELHEMGNSLILWPNLDFGDYLKEEMYEWASGLTIHPPSKLDKKTITVDVTDLMNVWRQIEILRKRVKGLERKLEVIGKRLSVPTRDAEDEILNYCILLETLLSKDSEREEITYRLALRGALLASGDEKQAIYHRKFLTELYRARSKIVHGAEVFPDAPTYSLPFEKTDGKFFWDNLPNAEVNIKEIAPHFSKNAMQPKRFLGPDFDRTIARIIRRLFMLAILHENLKNWDELIEVVDNAIVDNRLREQIYKM